MSAYLLRKSMENKTSSYRFISDKIDICNLLNEIYHGLVMSDGRQTEQKMRKIFQTAMKKYGEDFRKLKVQNMDYSLTKPEKKNILIFRIW